MTRTLSPPTPSLKVAIIGGGPAGLGTAIALSKVPGVEWTLYEKKPEISEIGNGISIQPNTWRMLEKLGASRHLTTDHFFRPKDGHYLAHRNGRTGVLKHLVEKDDSIPPHRLHARAHRAHLQQALLREVDKSKIRVGYKLIGFDRVGSGRLRLQFADRATEEVDLLIGADGLRSVVREIAFPNHNLSYTGTTCYRTLVKTIDAVKINGLDPEAITFWHGSGGKWVYTCPLAGGDWEITCAVAEEGGENRSSWGKEASVERFTTHFQEMCQPLQELFRLVTRVEQYDYFAGPRLETIVQPGIALVGDASHPLSGAFGAGAGFALEDAYVLAEALKWAGNEGNLDDALALYDNVRSPHYAALYGVLDGFAAANAELKKRHPDADVEIESRIAKVWGNSSMWMLRYEVGVQKGLH